MKWTVCLACLFSIAFPVRAASPLFTGLTPPGAQRGTEVDFVFEGQRLSDAKGILFHASGFEVTKLEVVDDKKLKARVKIAADCALGEHLLRIWTATGISELRTLRIGPFPCVTAIEPNNDAAHAQKLPLNVTVQGVVKNDESDFFSIEARKGERITVEVEGHRLGWTLFDPCIAIRKTDGTTLAESDDSSLGMQDPVASVIAPEDGTFVVELRSADYNGNDNCKYRLHVGTFPQPLVAYPPGGEAGTELSVKLLGDPSGVMEQTVKLPAGSLLSDLKYQILNLFAEQDGLAAPVPSPIRVSPFPSVPESEPNNDIQHPSTLDHALPLAFNGILSEPGDTDFFKFRAKKDEAWEVRVFARALRSPLDSVLAIFDAKGKQFASNDDAGTGNPDSFQRFKVPADGEYCISVRDQLRRGGANFVYRIEITPVTPTVTLAFPEFVKDTQERQSIVVPRGNRFATLIRAKRNDTDSELALDFSDLPSGVSFQGDPMPGNADTVPVVFEAASDAQIAGKLCGLSSRLVDTNKKAESWFVQTVVLVFGQPNNTPYYQTRADKIAIAVAEEAPFTLRVVEPKAPIVQNGAMQLKAIIERKPGFDAPVNISLLYKPPGIGAEAMVKIPAGQNETTILLSANGDAQMRKWKTALVGSGDAGKGAVWVSSQLFALEVAQPFVTATIERAAVEQGQSATVVCKLKQNKPFDGKAKIKLLGLPNKVTAPEMEITAADQEVRFQIQTDKASPAGQHKSLFCQVTVMKDAEPVLHTTGQGGVLRIDKATQVIAAGK